ncbi:MAG TPA: transcriptional regulator NrdR [Thermoleophilaceae bacterium]
MRCPYCHFDSTRVVDSRLAEPGDSIRRRRECASCGERFTTYERVEGPMLIVDKRDGRREQFDRDKLIRGMLRSTNKRPVEVSDLEELADRIAGEARRRGGRVDAEWIGERVLRGLARLDRVSALLFASIYRSFEDLSDFESELERLKSEPVLGDDQLPLVLPSDPRERVGTSPSGTSRGQEGELESVRRGHAGHP